MKLIGNKKTQLPSEYVELTRRIKYGDQAAEEQFVIRFGKRVKRLLVRLTHNNAQSEDLSHETLIIVLQKLRHSGLEDPERLQSYVYGTARNLHKTWLRKKANQVELCEKMDDFLSHQDDIEQLCIKEERWKGVRDNIYKLNLVRDKEILIRHYVNEQSKTEICEALVLSMPNFDRVISRARHRLRSAMIGKVSNL